ncbi:hypothetical protein RB596_003579 [Gaeumannomyces avenae]
MSLEPFPVLVHPFPGPTPRSCAYEAGSPTSPNALVFIGGLGDGPHTVPYVRTLAARLQSEPGLGYSLFEVRLASAFSGFGHRRLADDVADVAALVRHLRGTLRRRRVVLLGHSTGCQGCMEYTDYARHGAEPVDGFVLQGPVSDREAFGPLVPREELEAGLASAAELVGSGRGNTIMPKDEIVEMFGAPITAYRYHSLLAPGSRPSGANSRNRCSCCPLARTSTCPSRSMCQSSSPAGPPSRRMASSVISRVLSRELATPSGTQSHKNGWLIGSFDFSLVLSD